MTVEGEIGVTRRGRRRTRRRRHRSGTLTDPDQAVEFAELTGVDSLAIAIGTNHGAYKFTKKPDGSVLKTDVLIAIHKRLPQDAPGDARQLVERARGPARRGVRVRRQAE